MHAKDNEDNMTIVSKCKHLSTIDDLTEYFVNNLNLLA